MSSLQAHHVDSLPRAYGDDSPPPHVKEAMVESKPEHASHVRLAQCEFAAVDLCDCGALQIHLGDLSLRLPAELVQALTRTLGAALSRRQALLLERAKESASYASWGGGDTPPGKA